MSANEVGAGAPLRLGQGHAGLATRLLALQQVRHVSGQVPHGLQPLRVLRGFAGFGAVRAEGRVHNDLIVKMSFFLQCLQYETSMLN